MKTYRIYSPAKDPGRPQDRTFLRSWQDPVPGSDRAYATNARWSWTAIIGDALVIDGRAEAERIADHIERWQEREGYTKGRCLVIVSTAGGNRVARPPWKAPQTPTLRGYVDAGCTGPGPPWFATIVARAGSRAVRPLTPSECAALVRPHLDAIEGMPTDNVRRFVSGVLHCRPGKPNRAATGRPPTLHHARRIFRSAKPQS